MNTIYLQPHPVYIHMRIQYMHMLIQYMHMHIHAVKHATILHKHIQQWATIGDYTLTQSSTITNDSSTCTFQLTTKQP